MKTMDPTAAEKLRETMREVAEEVRKAKVEEAITDAHLQGHLKALSEYRASFSDAELNGPAVWMDKSGDGGRRRLDAKIAELQRLTPEEQQQVDSLGREARPRA